jgi:hypothetical protein
VVLAQVTTKLVNADFSSLETASSFLQEVLANAPQSWTEVVVRQIVGGEDEELKPLPTNAIAFLRAVSAQHPEFAFLLRALIRIAPSA